MEIPNLRVVVTIGPVSPNFVRKSKWNSYFEGQKSDKSKWAEEPLQALIICRTISAAPRLWSRDCWYSSLCFSISFSCRSDKLSELLPLNEDLTRRINRFRNDSSENNWQNHWLYRYQHFNLKRQILIYKQLSYLTKCSLWAVFMNSFDSPFIYTYAILIL